MIIVPIENVVFVTEFTDSEGTTVTSAWLTYESARSHIEFLGHIGYNSRIYVKIDETQAARQLAESIGGGGE